MDRKYRNKIEKSLEKTNKKIEEMETDKEVMKSAERLASLLPNNVNKAKIISQLYAGKALDVLIKLIEDETVPAEVRRKCIGDLLARAYGLPEQNIKSVNVGMTLEVSAETFEETDISLKSNQYIESGIPSNEWPPDVRQYFGLPN